MPYLVIENKYIVGYARERGLYAVYDIETQSNFIKLDNFNIFCPESNKGLSIVYILENTSNLVKDEIKFSKNTIIINNKYKDFTLTPIDLNVELINDKFYNINQNELIICKLCKEFMTLYDNYNVAYCPSCKEGFKLDKNKNLTGKRIRPSYRLHGPIELSNEL